MDYAELHCLSNFSFQRGASSAQELFVRAKALGYRALAITDEASLAGIVRAYEAVATDFSGFSSPAFSMPIKIPDCANIATSFPGFTGICERLGMQIGR